MLFQTLSLCSGPPSALSKMLEKMEKGESLVFPTMGSVECLGSAVIGGGGGRFGGQAGCRSAVQRLAFCIVGQLGIKVLCAAE